MANVIKNFQWVGIDKEGKRTNGFIEANDIQTAQTNLKKNGIEITNIRETKKAVKSDLVKKRIKQKDIILFTRFLSTMTTAGLPVLQSIDIIAHDQKNINMRSLLLQIRANVAGGKTLTESFHKHPKYFGSLFCSLISVGEKSGTLDKILNRLASYLEKTDTIRRKIKKALLYPIIIIAISFIVSGILLIFVVPKFQEIYSSFGAQLPYFTQVIINLSSFVKSFWWIVLLLLTGIFFTIRHLIKTNEKVAYFYDKTKLKISIIGPLMQKGIIARFARTLAITVDSGLPIVDGMRSMADIVDNLVFKKAILDICSDVVNGHQLNVAMNTTNLFPNMVIQMIAIGEASGSLGEMLNKVADYYEEDVNNMVDNLSNLLEPFIMVLLGIIIGSFVIAMYLPIFKIGSIVK